ncbi:MAG: Rap1a/Tai family immunity protein [Pseudomonadota bacterium]
MKRLVTVAAATALLGLSAMPAQAESIMKEDFEGATVAQVVKLCSPGENDGMGQYAMGYCYGWIAGIEQFYDALVADPRFNFTPSVCTDSEISREEARQTMIAWAVENPDSASMPALSGLIAAMRAKYPC